MIDGWLMFDPIRLPVEPWRFVFGILFVFIGLLLFYVFNNGGFIFCCVIGWIFVFIFYFFGEI